MAITMRKRWGYAVILLLCISLFALVEHIRAADASVRVTLPDFAVNLNGHPVENQYREYPLLVYNGITYFPMTWYDSRLLGLEVTWSPENGLDIKQSPVTSSYVPNKSERRNASAYTAEVPTSAVTINGKVIDNSKEEYPLLSFRDVTYFPLTWKFAHDEFGWDYRWDEIEGLRITSHNPRVQTVELPAYAGENGVALFKGYYYFVETTEKTNRVYRVPVHRPSDMEKIYSYNLTEGYNGLNQGLTFQIRDNALWFTYHVGEGLTGRDQFVKISEDGRAEVQDLGHPYMDFRETPYGTLIIDLGASEVKLSLLPPGQEKTKARTVGDPHLRKFPFLVTGGDGSTPYVRTTATTVLGDDVYVLCSELQYDQNFIYRINLKTNKTERIVSSGVRWFKISDNKLYYVKDEDNMLYSSALDGTDEMKLSDHAVSWFDSIAGKVFYTTEKDTNRFELYQADPNGKDPLVWKTPIAGVQVLNDRLICHVGENDDYGVVLLDGSGQLVLKVADPISRVLTSDEGVLLKSARDSSVKFIR